MDLELDGKAVVICGGARGIGFACAEAFAREGARIAIFDWDAEDLAKADAAIRAMGVEVFTRQVDVSHAETVESAHAHVREIFGAIDVGFNNAGIGSPFRPIDERAKRTGTGSSTSI